MNLILPMIKEEWRMHSTLFGGMFGVFPLMILCSTFLGALLHPYYSMIIPERQMLLIISYLFVMFGASAGGFGLLGREAMNRRFGQSSLIAYSSRTLPVSEKQIFSAFFVKEILYYIAYWTLPFVGGFFFASFFIGYPAATSMHLFISLTLSFLLGLTVSFVLSTIFVNTNKRLFSAVFVVLLTIAYIYQDKLSSLPSFQYMITKAMTQLLGSLGFVGSGSVVSILSM